MLHKFRVVHTREVWTGVAIGEKNADLLYESLFFELL